MEGTHGINNSLSISSGTAEWTVCDTSVGTGTEDGRKTQIQLFNLRRNGCLCKNANRTVLVEKKGMPL